MNENELMYLLGNINNFKARYKTRDKDSFGYEVVTRLVELGNFITPLLSKLSEEELQSLSSLYKTAGVVDDQFTNGVQKTLEQREQELNMLNNLINQTSYYYELNYGYKNNNMINDDIAQSIQLNEIREYLLECQKLANVNIDDTKTKMDTISEYQSLIGYLSLLELIVKNNKDDSEVLQQVSTLVDKFIKVLNNSQSLYELKLNTYNLKAEISDLNDNLNNGMKM